MLRPNSNCHCGRAKAAVQTLFFPRENLTPTFPSPVLARPAPAELPAPSSSSERGRRVRGLPGPGRPILREGRGRGGPQEQQPPQGGGGGEAAAKEEGKYSVSYAYWTILNEKDLQSKHKLRKLMTTYTRQSHFANILHGILAPV